MEQLAQLFGNLAALSAIGLALASPLIVYREILEHRKAKRWNHIIELQEALDHEYATALGIAGRQSDAVMRQHDLDEVQALNRKIRSGLVRRLRLVVSEYSAGPCNRRAAEPEKP
jgi:hypothetical protein